MQYDVLTGQFVTPTEIRRSKALTDSSPLDRYPKMQQDKSRWWDGSRSRRRKNCVEQNEAVLEPPICRFLHGSGPQQSPMCMPASEISISSVKETYWTGPTSSSGLVSGSRRQWNLHM